MKIISLNTWGGRAGKGKLLDFFKANEKVDIFCLQEIWAAPYNDYGETVAGGLVIDHEQILTNGRMEIPAALPNHQHFFRPHHGDNYGLMMLISDKFKVEAEGEIFVYKEKGYMPKGDIGGHARNIQYVTIEKNGKLMTIINFHDLWTGTGKKDTDDRIEQSKKILAFISTLKHEYILCGDFNLLPDTKSIHLFEDAGLVNLIRDHNVTSTRTSFYTKPDKYADYIFVSKGVCVREFKVLPEEVSDHNALLIEIE